MAFVGGLPTRISAERQFLHIVDPAMVKLSTSLCFMKVYIVEDAPETRKDIANALAPIKDIEVVGEAESVCDARKGICSLSPEAVILDISLPDGSGVEILKLIRNWRKSVLNFTKPPGPTRRNGDRYWHSPKDSINGVI